MRTPVDRATIRRAIEKAREHFDAIEAERELSTPQTIALYLWLIDYEALNAIQPLDRLHRLLITCLENQVITHRDRETLERLRRCFLNADKPIFTSGKRLETLEL